MSFECDAIGLDVANRTAPCRAIAEPFELTRQEKNSQPRNGRANATWEPIKLTSWKPTEKKANACWVQTQLRHPAAALLSTFNYLLSTIRNLLSISTINSGIQQVQSLGIALSFVSIDYSK